MGTLIFNSAKLFLFDIHINTNRCLRDNFPHVCRASLSKDHFHIENQKNLFYNCIQSQFLNRKLIMNIHHFHYKAHQSRGFFHNFHQRNPHSIHIYKPRIQSRNRENLWYIFRYHYKDCHGMDPFRSFGQSNLQNICNLANKT